MSGNPVPSFVAIVRSFMADGLTMADAVRLTIRRHPALWTDVHCWIGDWPSSEPILREAQKQS